MGCNCGSLTTGSGLCGCTSIVQLPIGVTGPQGLIGPAGADGLDGSSVLHNHINLTTPISLTPGNVAAEAFDVYAMPAGLLGNDGDSLEINTLMYCVGFNGAVTRTFDICFGPAITPLAYFVPQAAGVYSYKVRLYRRSATVLDVVGDITFKSVVGNSSWAVNSASYVVDFDVINDIGVYGRSSDGVAGNMTCSLFEIIKFSV